MKYCKKHIIATCFSLVFPLSFAWAQAPVVDDSDSFAMMDERAYDAPAAQVSKYDNGFGTDDDSALVKEDHNNLSYNEPSDAFKDSAKLIDKLQALQQEVQELRGQLEVQAHDLKLLQQQQLAFYKDLDTRLSSSGTKIAPNIAPAPIAIAPKTPQPITPAVKPKVAQTPMAAQVTQSVARGNPADEQISYLAAYELIKNKKFEEAINSMQIFVQKYPRGGYTANAQYWLGELYLQKKDFGNAIAHFEVVINQFPSSSKAGDSLLKLGYAHAAAGNKQEAKIRLQTVLKNYPNTPMAQLAQLKLETLNAL